MLKASTEKASNANCVNQYQPIVELPTEQPANKTW